MTRTSRAPAGGPVCICLTADEATELVRDALIAAGAGPRMADAVSEHAVDAELAGHPSHGLRQIPGYCANAGSPGFDLTAEPRIVSQRAALTKVDAQGGLGHLALATAVDRAAEHAAFYGVGVGAVVRCGHAGRAGAWVERGALHGCLTLVALGGSDPPFAMAAGPGAVPALHTNPLAVAAPGGQTAMVLDMATSLVAEGKVHVALDGGAPLPAGSILTAAGVPSGDPAELARGGCLLPLAGHKGFGLSAIVESLAVAFTGADAPGMEPREGATVICLAVAAFRPAAEVRASVDTLRARIRASGTDDAVLAPGDPEARSRAAAAGTVTLTADLLERLRALALGGEG